MPSHLVKLTEVVTVVVSEHTFGADQVITFLTEILYLLVLVSETIHTVHILFIAEIIVLYSAWCYLLGFY